MSTILAWPLLFEAVVAGFQPAGDPLPAPLAAVTFGWRAPDEYEPGARVVFVPGDDGEVGSVVAPRVTGSEPEAFIAQLDELFTIYVASVDETNPDDELLQYTKTRFLFDDLIAIIYRHAAGTFRIESNRWHKPKGTRRIGSVLRLVCSLEAPIPDLPVTYAPADTRARITPILSDTPDDPAPDWVPDPPPEEP